MTFVCAGNKCIATLAVSVIFIPNKKSVFGVW